MTPGSVGGDLFADPMMASAAVLQSIVAAQQAFVLWIAAIDSARWPTEPKNGQTYLNATNAAVGARAKQATDQIASCQAKILESATRIAAARLEASVATDAKAKVSKHAIVDSRVLEGRARVAELAPAAAWLREDLASLQASVAAAERKAAAADTPATSPIRLDKAALDAALDAFGNLTTGNTALACAATSAK